MRKVPMSELKKRAEAFMKISKEHKELQNKLRETLLAKDNPILPIRVYRDIVKLEGKYEQAYTDLERALGR